MMGLKFCDMLATERRRSYPIAAIDESIFTDGLGFDGTSIRGWPVGIQRQSNCLALCLMG
jgi:glutamine synthetase